MSGEPTRAELLQEIETLKRRNQQLKDSYRDLRAKKPCSGERGWNIFVNLNDLAHLKKDERLDNKETIKAMIHFNKTVAIAYIKNTRFYDPVEPDKERLKRSGRWIENKKKDELYRDKMARFERQKTIVQKMEDTFRNLYGDATTLKDFIDSTLAEPPTPGSTKRKRSPSPSA